MLAILQIKMYWTKENRTSDGARRRQQYYAPVLIEPDVPLAGDGIFVKKCYYTQDGTQILCAAEASRQLDARLRREYAGVPFSSSDEHEQKMARCRNDHIRRDLGSFFDIGRVDIPCVQIIEEPDLCYRVKWFDDRRHGMPKRRGGNEDFRVKGTRLAGQPNTLNETAFILRPGESGILKYNYRYACYDGQWYECYYVYVVNTDRLSHDVFIRNYTYTYDQLADLF